MKRKYEEPRPVTLAEWLVDTRGLFGAKQYVNRLLDTPTGEGVNPGDGSGWSCETWLAVDNLISSLDSRQRRDVLVRLLRFKASQPPALPPAPIPPEPVEAICECGHSELDHTGKAFGFKCTDCDCKKFSNACALKQVSR